jgi:dUTPase
MAGRTGSADEPFFDAGNVVNREPPTVVDMVTVLDSDLYEAGLQQGYANDVCVDLAVRYSSPQLAAHTTHRAPLGISVAIPDGYVGIVVPRTSTASEGVQVSTPVIDPGYEGEVHTWLTSPVPTRYARGQLLVGLLVVPCVPPGATARRDGPRGIGTTASSDTKGPTP